MTLCCLVYSLSKVFHLDMAPDENMECLQKSLKSFKEKESQEKRHRSEGFHKFPWIHGSIRKTATQKTAWQVRVLATF